MNSNISTLKHCLIFMLKCSIFSVTGEFVLLCGYYYYFFASIPMYLLGKIKI